MKNDNLARTACDTTPAAPPGGPPAGPGGTRTVMQAIAFNPDGFAEMELPDAEAIRPFLDKFAVTWLNVDGPVSPETLSKIGEIFGLHPLALEDVAKANQRIKVEPYGKHVFVVTRMLSLGKKLETEQLSLFFGDNFVVTFQERVGGDCLDAVRDRIRRNLGSIRQEKPDHLAYALLDAVIDVYFPVLERIGERLEALEEEILARHDKMLPSRVHDIKRDILTLRRTIWPMRDAINALVRDSNSLVSANTRLHLRDCHDHVLRIMDMVETDRELCADLRDLHMVSVSNRLNEVMKVLTVITTLFLGPSLIAGIYGMNFNHERSPWNMPELNWFFGYPFALGLMLAMVTGLLVFLRWAGCLGGSQPWGKRPKKDE